MATSDEDARFHGRGRRLGPLLSGIVSRPLTIVVGEDQALVREGIVRMLERAGLTIAGVAADATELLRSTRAHRPDVVITDIRMPPGLADDGLRAAMEIRDTEPGIGVIVLSQYLEDRFVLELVGDRADGVGYLLKEKVGNPQILIDAVRRVADGLSALDPDVIARLVGRKRVDSPLALLTPRERDVLALMAEGRSNTGIAERLVVTVPAIERHVTGIFSKLDLDQSDADQHRRVLAVLRYLQG
jgi:DNA-binding NarL/FixJ family response regulator